MALENLGLPWKMENELRPGKILKIESEPKNLLLNCIEDPGKVNEISMKCQKLHLFFVPRK